MKKANGTQVETGESMRDMLAAMMADQQRKTEEMIATALAKAEPTIVETRRQERNSKRSLSKSKVTNDPPEIVGEWSEYKGQTYFHVSVQFPNGYRKRIGSATSETWKAVLAFVATEI